MNTGHWIKPKKFFEETSINRKRQKKNLRYCVGKCKTSLDQILAYAELHEKDLIPTILQKRSALIGDAAEFCIEPYCTHYNGMGLDEFIVAQIL